MRRSAPPQWDKGKGSSKRIKCLSGVALKMLLPEAVAGKMIGKGGGLIKEIQTNTGAQIHLSNKGEYYPGTDLQEVNIQATTMECLDQAIERILTQALDDGSGGFAGGITLVTPRQAASTLIGKGGATIKQLQQSTGVKAHIEEHAAAIGETQEQVINLHGHGQGLLDAVSQVSGMVQELKDQPWFYSWASNSLASDSHRGGGGGGGPPMWGPAPGGKGKAPPLHCKSGPYAGGGKGKWEGCGKGKWDDMMHGNGGAKGAWDGGYGKAMWDAPPPAKGSKGAWDVAPPAMHAMGNGKAGKAKSKGDPVGLVASAVETLPWDCFEPGLDGPQISLNVPDCYCSALIGRGGSGTKEIAAVTGARIGVRENVEDPTMRRVEIIGPTAAIAAAYLRVVGRLVTIEKEAEVAEAGRGAGGAAQSYEEYDYLQGAQTN